ncbi:MAG: hypothetical protein JWP27_2683 [Flaviaesturariibacter sp.]|nr:hypothetical protein [Flaviaesturariibacter sp.]
MDSQQPDALPGKAPVDFRTEGIKYGIINGLIGLALLFGSYFCGFETFAKVQFLGSFVPYMAVVLILAGFQLRKRNGGYLSFKEAIKFTFLSYIVAAVLLAIGNYILFVVVDKGLTERLFRFGVEKNIAMLHSINAPQSEIDKVLKEANANKTETNFKNIFLGMGINLIRDFVVSMLISILIRRERPALN